MNILEQFLAGYKGCLLVVSHDRYFMDKVADTLFVLEDDGSVSGFVGKCSEYIEYRREKQEHAAAVEKAFYTEKKKNGTEESGRHDDSAQQDSGSKPRRLSFKEQREFEQLEKDIALMESRQKELEKLMSSADCSYSRLGSYNSEYQKLGAELETKYARWEILAG